MEWKINYTMKLPIIPKTPTEPFTLVRLFFSVLQLIEAYVR